MEPENLDIEQINEDRRKAIQQNIEVISVDNLKAARSARRYRQDFTGLRSVSPPPPKPCARAGAIARTAGPTKRSPRCARPTIHIHLELGALTRLRHHEIFLAAPSGCAGRQPAVGGGRHSRREAYGPPGGRGAAPLPGRKPRFVHGHAPEGHPGP
jgi:hypothetical protein